MPLTLALVVTAASCGALGGLSASPGPPASPARSGSPSFAVTAPPRAAHDVAISLGSITGLAAAPDGSLYVVAFGDNQIRHLATTGRSLGSWGKAGSGPGEFGLPGNIAVSPDGTVYVADHDNDRIQAFTPDGRFLRRFGSRRIGPGQFSHPVALAVDAAANVYVGEDRSARVLKFDRTHTIPL